MGAPGVGISATGAEPAVHGGHKVEDVKEPPATLTGYAPTGRETAVDTDVPLTGYSAGGARHTETAQETVTGYEPTGAGISAAGENEVGLGGYIATGGQAPPAEGQKHVAYAPKYGPTEARGGCLGLRIGRVTLSPVDLRLAFKPF
jgi:hypothetical protein